MNCLQNYPLIRIVGVLIMGVLFCREVPFYVPTWLLLVGICVTVCTSVVCNKKPITSTISLFLSTFFLGGWLLNHCENYLRISFPNHPVHYQGVVASQPQMYGKVFRFDLLIVSKEHPFVVKASLLNDPTSGRARSLRVGDGIEAFSLLEEPVDMDDVSSYLDLQRLHVQGLSGTTFIASHNWSSVSVPLTSVSRFERARLRLLRLREHVKEKFSEAGVTEEALPILSAMTLGDRSGLSRETKNVFAIAGVGHLLALSGMHLGILYGLLMVCFGGRRNGIVGQSIALSAIWCYVFFVGMPFSVVRSAIMCTVYGLVSLLNRDKVSLNVLALSAFLILIAFPLCLWDVGFQLSFISVLGILLVCSLNIRFSSIGILQYLCSALLVSFVAQLMVMPLVMHYFGRVPVYFLLTNLFAITVSAFIIMGAIALLFLSSIGLCQTFFAEILSYVITVFYKMLRMIASWPYADVCCRLSPIQTLLSYILILSSVYVVYRVWNRWRMGQ